MNKRIGIELDGNDGIRGEEMAAVMRFEQRFATTVDQLPFRDPPRQSSLCTKIPPTVRPVRRSSEETMPDLQLREESEMAFRK